ncbi:MAG: CBS domain-containing protein [Desulfobulbaceae bacterium]|nr:CBS domain-containing protein [Desulfobulbaceae bacterium]
MDIITTHLNADFDALAAMVAAKKLYPEAEMVFPGSQERNVREYIKHTSLVYTFPRLKNINLSEVTRLIVVDTRQRSRIGALSQCLGNPNISLHLYDHHPNAPDDMHGDLEEIRTIGSTTSIFVDIFKVRQLSVTPDEATLMTLAIHEDTGSFLFDTTTPQDLSAASWLLEHGANLNVVSPFMVQELSAAELGILSELIDSATTYSIQGLPVVVARITLPNYIDEFALLVRKFMMIENLDTLFALATMGDRLYLIARSRVPEVNVGTIALEFGGGGHASAASATIKDMTLIEAEEKLVLLLHEYVHPRSLARELMSAPVISVPPEMSIAQVNEILTRYNLTVVPVLDTERRALGLISRRVTEKSIFHGLGHLPASEYMSTDFATLSPDASLRDIQERIIEHRQRFIPVLEDERVVGVITRTDLLNLLARESASNSLDPDREEQPSSVRHRNLNTLMVNSLPKEMIVLLRTIGEVAEEMGFSAFVVGGFVRDLLRHSRNSDLDIVIEGDGICFAKELAGRLGGVARTHEKFNTAVVKLSDGFKVDVATARLEYYEYPAALPTVEMSSIKLDLFRRDFTMNALAISLNPKRFGLLVDFFNCQNDIRDQQIRVLHNLSFVEDPTRIFRAIRFEQRLGFKLGKFTERLIKSAIRQEMFGQCSGKRFFQELKYILAEENPQPAVYRLASFNLLTFFHPALKLDQRLKNILRETHRSVAWYKLLYRGQPFRQWLIFLLALTARLTVRQVSDVCRKFEISERDQEALLKQKMAVAKILKVMNKRIVGDDSLTADLDGASLDAHGTEAQVFSEQGPPLRPSEIYWLLKGLSTEGLLHLMGLLVRRAGKQAVSMYVTELSRVSTFVQGADLRAMGYPVGPLYATILNHLLEVKLDGFVVSAEDEVSFLRQHYPLAKGGGRS